jgi:hypothetical protein
MLGNATKEMLILQQKRILINHVEKNANRPLADFQVVSSVAFEGLRSDYLKLCGGHEGGLAIVYDKHGMGKSRALQGVARAKSVQQPHRFLVINSFDSAKT